MTHFLFLEKGAQLRDAQRAQRDKSSRDGAAPRSRRQENAAATAAPALVFLMLPTANGYRVLRAALEEVAEIPASELGRGDAAGASALLERLLGATQAAQLLRVGDQAQDEAGGTTRTSARTTHESFGEIEIDVPARVVTRRGAVVPLAPMEFDLLLALARRNGAAASRKDLLREVWGTTKAVSLRTVDTHVSNLRRKIEVDAAHPRHILTVKKVGYRLQR
jgi:two-component system response regulator MtrA